MYVSVSGCVYVGCVGAGAGGAGVGGLLSVGLKQRNSLSQNSGHCSE